MPNARGGAMADRLVLLEAALALLLANAAVHALPFRVLARFLGRHAQATPIEPLGERGRAARRVRWAITSAGSRVPWRPLCLAQAVAAKAMLGRRGVPNTLYLGVVTGEPDGLAAHAWVRAGRLVVTGAGERWRFTRISSFA